MSPRRGSPRTAASVAAICAALAAAVLVPYAQVLGHGFVNFDDDSYITENPQVLRGLTWSGARWAFTTTAEGNWHPLTWLSHMLDVDLFGTWAGGHHATSALLHALGAALLFVALFDMSGALGASALVAALFAVHPLRVESVAWAAERKDVLSGLFWMAALLAYSRYARRPAPGRYALVLAAFVLGLLAKPMLVTLPFVLLLLDSWPLARRIGMRARILEKLPLIAAALASSAVTLVAQSRGGAASSFEAVPLGARLANAAQSYVWYLWKTLVPTGLAIFYPHPALLGRGVPLLPGILAAAALLAASALVLRAAPRRPYLATGWLWYLGTLVPVIGIVQVGRQALADRYTYIPLIGISILVAWSLRELEERRPALRRPVQIGSLAALLVLVALTWAQAGTFRDGITLYRHALAVTAENYLVHNNLGVALAERGRLAEAEVEYEAALAIKPDYPEAHNNLGTALKKRGNLAEAERHFKTAIGLRPDFDEPHANLGNVYLARGDLQQARTQYEAALRLRPDSLSALLGLGTVLARRGDAAGAARAFERAVALAPRNWEALKNLGIARMLEGRLPEAAGEYRAALEIRPRDPDLHADLGILYLRMGDVAQARAELARALEIRPDHPSARAALEELRVQSPR